MLLVLKNKKKEKKIIFGKKIPFPWRNELIVDFSSPLVLSQFTGEDDWGPKSVMILKCVLVKI